MRKLSLIPLVLAFAFACGGGPSDGDVKAATEGIKSVYAGLYEILEANKANPAQAVAKGEEYVDGKVDELKKHGAVLGQGMSPDQIVMVEEFQSEIQDMGRKSAQSLRSSFAGSPDQVRKLGKILDKLGQAYVSGAQENQSAVAKAAGAAGVAAAKKALIVTAKATAGDIPEVARDQTLDGWVQSIAAQGADEAEQKAFREELKSELGW